MLRTQFTEAAATLMMLGRSAARDSSLSTVDVVAGLYYRMVCMGESRLGEA
jgi:hypothetical protein